MKANNNLLAKAEKVATDILQNELSLKLAYHSYDHTRAVVDAAILIGKEEQLNEDEMETLLLAAWFHDTGHRDDYDQHEEKSRIIAREFLTAEKAPTEKIEQVDACIIATKPDITPQTKLEKVLCDADMYHISTKDYETWAKRIRKEWASQKKEKYTDIEWYKLNLEFISRHKFHTRYGQEVLAKGKEEVRDNWVKKMGKLQKKIDKGLMSEMGVTPEELKSLKKKLAKAKGKPERGIETMFRLTSRNHMTLSQMADSKANIMISVNSIIISILIGGLMQKLDNNPHLIIPTVILLAVNLVSMVFSILSIRPNVTKGLFTREDIENQRTNLLFFGNFHKMKRNDYHWGMNELMDKGTFLYSSLIDDIYFLGVVLAKKYRLLRFSYNSFMYGIVIAVIAFVVSNFFVVENPPPEIPILD